MIAGTIKRVVDDDATGIGDDAVAEKTVSGARVVRLSDSDGVVDACDVAVSEKNRGEAASPMTLRLVEWVDVGEFVDLAARTTTKCWIVEDDIHPISQRIEEEVIWSDKLKSNKAINDIVCHACS